MKNKILDRIQKSYKNYILELQKGLTAIPAISPASGGQGEYDKAVWLDKQLRRLRFDEIRWVSAPDRKAKKGIRPSIVARYRGRRPGKTLWLMSHLDIVPPGELSLWKGDPYKLRVNGRRIYGRGVEDNQQAVVSSLLVARAMMDCGYRPDVGLALLFVADEEMGSLYGVDHIVKKHPKLFGRKDMFIVPDGGNPQGSLVEVAEKSICWLKFTTSGRQCHASRPCDGINAFRAASDLVTRLGGLRRRFSKKDPLFDPPVSTFEPTKKEANVPNVNTIPGEDVFCLDCRLLPCYTLDQMKAEIRRHVRAVEKAHGVRIAMEVLQEGAAAPPTPSDCELVRLLTSAIREVRGIRTKPQGIGGGTVAAFFRRAGLHAVVYSKLDETAHQPNEYCVIDNLIGDAKIFALCAMNAAGAP